MNFSFVFVYVHTTNVKTSFHFSFHSSSSYFLFWEHKSSFSVYKIEPPIRAPPEDDYYHTRLIESHVGDYGDVSMHITNEVEIPEFYAIRTTKIPVREIAPYVISKK